MYQHDTPLHDISPWHIDLYSTPAWHIRKFCIFRFSAAVYMSWGYSYRYVMQIYHGDTSCAYVIEGCHEDTSWRYIMCLCHGVISWTYIMELYHSPGSWWYAIRICPGYMSCMYVYVGRSTRHTWHMIMTYGNDICVWHIGMTYHKYMSWVYVIVICHDCMSY